MIKFLLSLLTSFLALFSSPTPTPSPTTIPLPTPFPTQVNSSPTPSTESSQFNDCQPELFDPATTKYSLDPDQNGTPNGLYKVNEPGGQNFQINGWHKQNEEPILLNTPYSLTYYEFGCASTFSFVIEIKKGNLRHALYTHVSEFDVSPNKNYLYMTGDKGPRIITIASKKAVSLLASSCLVNSFWQQDQLLSYSNPNYENTPKYGYTDICLWNTSGQKMHAFEVPYLAFGAASVSFLVSPLGLLPQQPSILYYFTGDGNKSCTLFLHDLTSNSIVKTIKVVDDWNTYFENYGNYCQADLDLANFTTSSTSLRYRIRDVYSNGPETQSWQTITIE